MSTPIDSLSLEIESNSQSAVSGIEALKNSLKRLGNATKGGLGLSSVSENMGKLSDAVSKINSSSVGNVKALGIALKTFKDVKISSTISKNLSGIGDALSKLDVGGGESKITELVSALKPLETLGKSSLGTTVKALNKLPEAIQKIDMRKLHGQVDALTRTFKPLADEMQKIANGFNAFPSRIQNLIRENERLSHSNNELGTSYIDVWAKMKTAYSFVQKAAKTIGSFIKETNSYIENVNLFNVAMGEYAKEAGEYAEEVGNIMGIDPGEWMRNQGVFMTLATGFGVVSDRAYTMSKNLTQLGYDLSSFFNIGYEDAMEKLQSGIAGELEPLRRIGYDLSQARLQQEAYALGISKKVAKMTQAEKAELRYHAILTQVTTAQGDMARTLDAPANQLRVLKAQFTQAARAIGSIFIPMLNAVLPYITAFTILVRDAAAHVAALFGFKMPEVDYSGVDSLASGADDASNALSDAADNAKKLKKATLGFDELNVLETKDDSGDSTIGTGSGFKFELPEYDFVGDAVARQLDALKTSLGLTITDVFAEWGSEINGENLLEKIVTGLSAIGGAVIGFKLGGFKGAMVGAVVGTAMALAINSLVFDHNNKLGGKEFLDLLRDILTIGAGGAIGFAIGGLQGAAIGLTIGFSLVMLLEAVEMSGKTSVAHTLENALMTMAPAGLLVGLGKKLGNTFLQNFQLAFEGGLGTMGSLKTGLLGVSKSMTGLQRVFTGVLGAAVEFMAVFTGIKNITYDVQTGSASLGSIISGLIPVVAGLTAGFIAFSIAFNSTGIGLIITLCVGAVAGLIGMVSGLESAAEAAYQSTDDFRIMESIIKNSEETIERCNTALDTMKNGITNLDTVSNDFAMAGTLLGEIMDINENANASAYELAQMQVKVDILNGLNIDGLSLSIDETTGRVVQSRESVEELIKSLEKEAKMEAMRDLLVQTYKDQFAAQSDLNRATNDYNVASEALQKTRDALNNSEKLSFSQKRELRKAEEEQITALNAAADAVNAAKGVYDELGTTITDYTKELTNMKLEEVGVGDELCVGVNDALATVENAANQMPELGKNVADGLKTGVTANVKKEDYDSVWSKIGNWFKDLFGIHSPSTVFAEYGGNIAIGLLNGVNGGVSEANYKTIFGRVSAAFGSIKVDIVDIVNSILGFIERMANGVIDGINSMIRKLNSLRIDAPDWVEQMFGISSFGFNIPTLQHISVPRVELKANGGYVDQGQMFIAREAGAEMVGTIGRRTAVANNDQIVAGIASGVAEANTESNALLREQNTLLRAMLEKEGGVYLDGKSISRSVEKHQRERGRVLVAGGVY